MREPDGSSGLPGLGESVSLRFHVSRFGLDPMFGLREPLRTAEFRRKFSGLVD
jgi:hypothetical protein